MALHFFAIGFSYLLCFIVFQIISYISNRFAAEPDISVAMLHLLNASAAFDTAFGFDWDFAAGIFRLSSRLLAAFTSRFAILMLMPRLLAVIALPL